ncbi:MAG: DNA mismatch repair protein MutS [Limimaricola sp.]|uniref:Smr/MutS family protein n=1 Tax=Limimaricola sp. TaxID=2211665 RepID=UPI001D89A9DC|nr:Smr/MutS family protein [Limimaricola sp.]MBI1417230.1 DNA mismatch repair protein MutS [Limimaricola sp.]
MRRSRRLSAEERALWEHVARQATPLGPRSDKADDKPPFSPDPPPSVSPPPEPIRSFRLGERAQASETRPSQPSPPRLAMDAKAFGKLSRGRLAPEARIDLHGMTLAEAHPELISFILTAHATGRRLVLVITGKGKQRDDEGPMPSRHGVLRRQVPHWLSMPPLSPVILQVSQAHLKHGGAGAYYVYLRRHKT